MMSSEVPNPRAWLPLLLPGLLGLAIYWPTLGYDFVFDDLSLIDDNGPVRLGTTWLAYRPIRHLSYLLDFNLGGGEAWAYHLSNIVLHAANAVLVSSIALRLGAGLAVSVFGGMLFVAHPLAVEATAYVAGRRDLLALFFSLLSLLAWISARRRPLLATVALAAVVLATLSKESGLCAVVLCAVASLCGLGPSLARAAAPLFMTAGFSVSAALLYGAVGPWWVAPEPAAAVRIAGALSAHYAGVLVVPVPLSIEYPELLCRGVDCANLAGPASRLGMAFLVALAAVAVILVARTRETETANRAAGFAIASVAALFVIVSFTIGGHEPGADRHAYPILALLSVAVAVVGRDWGAVMNSGAARRVALTLAMVLVAVCVRTSEARIPVWETPWTLWASAVGHGNASARAHHNLGRLLAGEGAYSHARRHFLEALRADRKFSPAVVALAAIECERGRYRRAELVFEKARALGAPEADVMRVRAACDLQRTAG